ncbi:MAG: hypothetical protein JST51_01685 [Armatimonadetes bacterium]|nr:hypothetical protein [Armatimonadota bacterium]
MSFPGMSEEMLQREILRLVRNAYRPKLRFDGPLSRQEFEVLHKEYRSVGGHWDSTHELYARKDGKFDPDMYIDYSEQLVGSYDEAGTTTIVACRRLDLHRWKLINICLEAPNISVPTSFVAVRRQDSGVLVKGVRTSGLDVREIEPDQFFAKLALALHHGEADRQISSATMESQPGTRFIADIYVGQSLRTSFVFAP